MKRNPCFDEWKLSWLESWVFTSSQASEEAVHYITYIWKTTYSNSNQVFLKFCSIEFFLPCFFICSKNTFDQEGESQSDEDGWTQNIHWNAEYPLKLLLWWRNHIVLINIVYYIADIWKKNFQSFYIISKIQCLI